MNINKLMILLTLLFSTTIFAREQKVRYPKVRLPIDSTTGKITYTEKVIVDSSFSQNELYDRAKKCIEIVFDQRHVIIQMDQKDSGIVEATGNFPFPKLKFGIVESWDPYYTTFTLKLKVEDGSYQYWLTDFNYKNFSNFSFDDGRPRAYPRKIWYYILFKINREAQSMIQLIKTTMEKPSVI